MKLCVTGGAGYVGSVVAELLIERGHEVVVLDNLTTGHRDAVARGAKLVEGDVRDEGALARALDGGIDAVLHFAALSVVADSMRRPLDYFDNNVTGTTRLVRAMEARGIKRLVFSSTAAVYGTPSVLPIDEAASCRPENPYGWTKLTVEWMLAAARVQWGLSFVALRYFNAAGATAACGEDHRPESHLIPIVLDAALGRRGSVTVFGDDYPTRDGTCVRDYVHVSDLALAHVLALDAMERGFSGALNLGSEHGFSVREVIDATRRITGRNVIQERGRRREGDPPSLVASSKKAREVLQWSQERSNLDDIIASALAWHERNPNGYNT
jgi:UDP-glucose 4-epimerase